MTKPNQIQLECLYRISYQLTYVMFQPIHLVCLDDRNDILFILAGNNEEIEFKITVKGEIN